MSAPLSLVLTLGLGAAVLAQPMPAPDSSIVGEIRAFAMPPGKEAGARRLEELKARGWLECDGRSYPRADHPLLAALLSDAPGAGAPAGPFRVPDLGAAPGPGGQVRYLIYAGPPRPKLAAGSKPEAGLTLPPGHKVSIEVRLEGKIRKAATVVDKGAGAAPGRTGTTVAAWIIDPPGCGQACSIPRSADASAATIDMKPCPARTPCPWTFENTTTEPRHFAFRFQSAAAGGDRLQPQPLDSGAVPTGPCVFVAWANLPRADETNLEGAERMTLLVNVQKTDGACDPAVLKWY